MCSPIAIRTSGCILEAYAMQKEHPGQVVWVFNAGKPRRETHAYLIEESTGEVLNLEDKGYYGYRHYSQDELLALVDAGEARILPPF